MSITTVKIRESPAADELEDFIANVSGEVAKKISHEWEDFGIGNYEFWGAKGRDTNWQPVIQDDSILVEYPGDVLIIPTTLDGQYEGGGCGGEDAPHHRCSRQCTEVELEFVYRLSKVGFEKDKIVAEYLLDNC
jgi:hypothetical protein